MGPVHANPNPALKAKYFGSTESASWDSVGGVEACLFYSGKLTFNFNLLQLAEQRETRTLVFMHTSNPSPYQN